MPQATEVLLRIERFNQRDALFPGAACGVHAMPLSQVTVYVLRHRMAVQSAMKGNTFVALRAESVLERLLNILRHL